MEEQIPQRQSADTSPAAWNDLTKTPTVSNDFFREPVFGYEWD